MLAMTLSFIEKKEFHLALEIVDSALELQAGTSIPSMNAEDLPYVFCLHLRAIQLYSGFHRLDQAKRVLDRFLLLLAELEVDLLVDTTIQRDVLRPLYRLTRTLSEASDEDHVLFSGCLEELADYLTEEKEEKEEEQEQNIFSPQAQRERRVYTKPELRTWKEGVACAIQGVRYFMKATLHSASSFQEILSPLAQGKRVYLFPTRRRSLSGEGEFVLCTGSYKAYDAILNGLENVTEISAFQFVRLGDLREELPL